jgi:hypothetical protein
VQEVAMIWAGMFFLTKPAKSSVKNSVEIVTVQFWYAKHLKNKNLITVYIFII